MCPTTDISLYLCQSKTSVSGTEIKSSILFLLITSEKFVLKLTYLMCFLSASPLPYTGFLHGEYILLNWVQNIVFIKKTMHEVVHERSLRATVRFPCSLLRIHCTFGVRQQLASTLLRSKPFTTTANVSLRFKRWPTTHRVVRAVTRIWYCKPLTIRRRRALHTNVVWLYFGY